MTAISSIRSVVYRSMATVGIDSRRTALRMALNVAFVAAWSAVAIFLGLIVGFTSVLLPPMVTIGIVAVAGLVLLWVLPELPAISETLIRRVSILR